MVWCFSVWTVESEKPEFKPGFLSLIAFFPSLCLGFLTFKVGGGKCSVLVKLMERQTLHLEHQIYQLHAVLLEARC